MKTRKRVNCDIFFDGKFVCAHARQNKSGKLKWKIKLKDFNKLKIQKN